MVAGLLVFSFSHSYANNEKPQVLSSASSQPTYSDHLLSQTAQEINKIRSSNNLQPMAEDPTLNKIAEARALDMSKHHYYAHLDPSNHYFDYYLKSSGYNYKFSCENLNMAESNDVNVFVDGWMTSKKGHRECILNPGHKHYGYATSTIEGLTDLPGVSETVVVAIYSD